MTGAAAPCALPRMRITAINVFLRLAYAKCRDDYTPKGYVLLGDAEWFESTGDAIFSFSVFVADGSKHEPDYKKLPVYPDRDGGVFELKVPGYSTGTIDTTSGATSLGDYEQYKNALDGTARLMSSLVDQLIARTGLSA